FHIDHIIPTARGGATVFGNLCLSCPFCNQFKQQRTRARDPQTGRTTRLFNPRRDKWRQHFKWSDDGTQLVGLTASGRATVSALCMNNAISVKARGYWVVSGVHPPRPR